MLCRIMMYNYFSCNGRGKVHGAEHLWKTYATVGVVVQIADVELILYSAELSSVHILLNQVVMVCISVLMIFHTATFPTK